MVTPILRPDHIPCWHPYPGPTIYYDDTHTLARPYTMVTPTLRPDHILWWQSHSGWTIHYGDTSIPGLDHISLQHPVVWPNPSWPVNYGQLSTPAVHKSWYNAGTLCTSDPLFGIPTTWWNRKCRKFCDWNIVLIRAQRLDSSDTKNPCPRA